MKGDKANAKPDEKKKVYRPYPKKTDDGTKPKEGIPMLKYGKGNNFYKLKAALAEVAQEKFGNLGRLIEEDKYYEPEYTPMVAPAGVVLDADKLKLLKSAMIKEFASKVAKMEADRPKLYGLIRHHMSVESKDEVALLRERERFFSLYRKYFYHWHVSGGTVVEHMTLYVRVLGSKLKRSFFLRILCCFCNCLDVEASRFDAGYLED